MELFNADVQQKCRIEKEVRICQNVHMMMFILFLFYLPRQLEMNKVTLLGTVAGEVNYNDKSTHFLLDICQSR